MLEITSLTFMLNCVPLPVITDVQRKHVLVLPGKNFVTRLNNQVELLIAESAFGMVGYGRCFLQNHVRANHLPRNQRVADAEMQE